ncbi:FtsK/SpoIIIE family protein [Singulisphaera sp. GP187]|uniref:FtsK/SpoIIIE domain-containing protein n=1 Tax=Singulisphaera sp. GP187 TaxID=1882752 RepID=UPI00092C447C|nr:FtsK/SpoIIIE domain-containing protein [Singulisphaera sp. GP187]SIN91238.1 FtsK/SpoIIIE family protein [Singulisphaera sp. GP187]
MAAENPFRESRLNSSRNFRPEWDVPELNQGITKWLVEEVSHLRGRREPDPGQMIATMTGPPGYGKTHLFGRIAHLVDREVFFVFVPAFEEETAPLDHIRWHVVDALFRVSADQYSPLEMALGRLCRPAFANYFADLPPTLAARHEPMQRRLDELPEAVLEVVRQVKTLGPFLKLADSLLQILPHDAGIVRALALGWAPSPWSVNARRWLQGQDLPDAERNVLGLGEVGPTALEVLEAIPAIFGHDKPMMICCDQVEGILIGNNVNATNRLSSSLMDLLQAVPVQIVLSCFEDQWEKFYKNTFSAFKMRVKRPSFLLDDLKPEQAVQLIKSRMAAWSGRNGHKSASWPFNEASIVQLVREAVPTPRSLIQECGRRFDGWIEEGHETEIHLSSRSEAVDPTLLFLQEWNREIDSIRQDPDRSAENLPEDRLYRGVFEALKLAQSAQRMREFGGVRIVDVRDKAVKATATTRRPGATISLAAGPGEASQSVVVALTKVEASRSFGHYFKALFDSSADPIAGALLIHPKRDLGLGAGTRAAFEARQSQGKLRVMPLEDYPLTYQATECLATLLDRANARELVLNNLTLSAEDCRDLVIRTGVIDNLDLFKLLGHWKRPVSRMSPTSASATAFFVPQPVPAPGSAVAVAEVGEVVAVVAPAKSETAILPVPNPVAAELLGSWAEKKLAGAVKKLNLLGQGVEPDGFEVGPTFARLRVRPVGKTNFKGVCNKAVDLRISLGLEVVPIVGSQAGCISIDVQRPDRAVVSLAAALSDPPRRLDGMPAFPVGQDVTGQAHWLNLADPSDCHLLVAGTTGSGKSEFLRATIATLAARLEPERLQFVLIDPKRVTFNLQGASPFLKFPVAYGLDEALPRIEECMAEMDRRYRILEEKKLANVSELPPELLPRIVVIIDEFASFLEDKESKKVVTALLKRIGAMARAAGIHLILSTQRPDKDVITPLLRENLPGRIALRVASKAGSDLILGTPDAENLLGRGDLFWKKGGELLRLQSPYVPQAELERTLRCQA